ncbi:MAG: hypothetical protein IPM98_13030 [Lewinellaceae bacterium]|nr:hypothetical protein [Lewinellaceae bacterium]
MKVYSDTRSSTYKFVRVYSDYAGGASFDTAYFKNVIKNAEAYLKEIAQYSKETVSPDVVNQVHSRLKTIKVEGEILVDALMGYFDDTVRGAASVIQTLEVVKTVGSVAAVFIPGVGLVYGGIQNAAQQASGLAHGTQQSWNFKSTAREFAIGLAGFGAGKVAGAGLKGAGQVAKASGQSAAKWAGKYAPGVSEKLAKGAGKMAEKWPGSRVSSSRAWAKM